MKRVLIFVLVVIVGLFAIVSSGSTTDADKPVQQSFATECQGYWTNQGCREEKASDLPEVKQHHCENGSRSYSVGQQWVERSDEQEIVCKCVVNGLRAESKCGQPSARKELARTEQHSAHLKGACLSKGRIRSSDSDICTCIAPVPGKPGLRWSCEIIKSNG